MDGSNDAPEYMTTAELAKMLNVSPRTLRTWRGQGRGPAWVKLDRAVRYRRSTVEAWAAEREAACRRETSPAAL